MKNILTLLFIVVFTLPANIFAQMEIHGCVVDQNGDEMPGVNIIIQNTEVSAFTDIYGNFSATVNDTDRIRVSSVGYNDTVFIASTFTNDTIHLIPDLIELVEIPDFHSYWNKALTLCYFGDVNRLPYGFTAGYFHPYLFQQSILLSGLVRYKTNFQSDYDITLKLSRIRVTHLFEGCWLSASVLYRSRNILLKDTTLKINGYSFFLYFDFFINVTAGFECRNNRFNNEKSYGGILGIDKYIGATRTDLAGSLTLFDNDIEYSFSVFQKLPSRKIFLRRLRFGLEYQKYIEYSEFNMFLGYSFFY